MKQSRGRGRQWGYHAFARNDTLLVMTSGHEGVVGEDGLLAGEGLKRRQNLIVKVEHMCYYFFLGGNNSKLIR